MLVAAHKASSLPDDAAYLPVHVGHARSIQNLGYQSDADGENISAKNDSYCELTAAYWAWKNLPADVVGLSHYRRYFRGEAAGPNGSTVLSGEQMSAMMSTTDVVIARPRNYLIESVESHYRHGHYGEDLDLLRNVLRDMEPSYLESFETVMRGRSLSLYNMFLMRRESFDSYASWLFPLLEAVEPQIDNTSRDAYQRRTYGYLGERLLNVWVLAHSTELRVRRLPVVNTDGEPKLAKAVQMIRRKVKGTSPAES